jgi:hypothetical protein
MAEALLPALLAGAGSSPPAASSTSPFMDIAPQAKLERHRSPGLGAVAGFLIGLFSEMSLA